MNDQAGADQHPISGMLAATKKYNFCGAVDQSTRVFAGRLREMSWSILWKWW